MTQRVKPAIVMQDQGYEVYTREEAHDLTDLSGRVVEDLDGKCFMLIREGTSSRRIEELLNGL